MIVKRLWVDDMKRLFPTLDAFANKRQQHAIFFFGSIKESADMPMLVESRSCQVNGTFSTIHVIGLLWPIAWEIVAEAARPTSGKARSILKMSRGERRRFPAPAFSAARSEVEALGMAKRKGGRTRKASATCRGVAPCDSAISPFGISP